MKNLLNIIVLFSIVGMLALQAQVPPPAPAYQPLADDQLDQLLGPIALYPDPLIAQILPAATFPTEIVLADRFVSSGGSPGEIDQQPWDPSVQALARYPDVLHWMDENLDWTTELGQAFLNQQQDVMNTIQRLRQSAYNLGNLQSTPQQQVINDSGYIEIVPVNTQVIYVPIYQPSIVYYQSANGAPFITFSVGFAIGSWLNCDFDWTAHNIIVWHRDHPRPANWWHEPPRQRNMGHATVWQPENRPQRMEAYQGDRGWGTPQNQHTITTIGRPPAERPELAPGSTARPEAPPNHPVIPRGQIGSPITAQRSIPAANNRTERESNGAFIGVQSPSDTREYSNRGRQSMGTIHSPAQPQRSSPAHQPTQPSGGGSHASGGHNPTPQKH